MKAYLINMHLLVPRSRSSAKVKVKYKGYISQQMAVSGAFVFHKHILFFLFQDNNPFSDTYQQRELQGNQNKNVTGKPGRYSNSPPLFLNSLPNNKIVEMSVFNPFPNDAFQTFSNCKSLQTAISYLMKMAESSSDG